jgi:hypothetical protein
MRDFDVVKEMIIKATESHHTLKIKRQNGTRYERKTTQIKLAGKYLEDAGIKTGDKLQVTITKQGILITKKD